MFNLPHLFKKILAGVMSLVAMLAAIGPATFAPVDAENLLLNFSVISDTHIATLPEQARGSLLAVGLRDMAKAEFKSDALVITGDLTERGTAYEYDKLSGVLNTFCKTDNLLLQMGNHDIRGIAFIGELRQTYEEGLRKYNACMLETTGFVPEPVYYYKIIKGCYFILLNPEALEDLRTSISTEQLDWLEDLLEQALITGKPVFVFNHQPMKSIGPDAEALMAVLQKYNGTVDIFFITGHKHNGFSADTITNDGTLYFVDMPAYGKVPDYTNRKVGSGLQVELYEDEIIFRPRNFVQGEWIADCERTIELLGATGSRPGSG